MTWVLNVALPDGAQLDITLHPGDAIFALGANGSGKSSLMHRLYTQHNSRAKRISAHRQTWLPSNDLALSSMQRRNTEQAIKSQDTNSRARWTEEYSVERSSIALYDLVDAENVRARGITAAVDGADLDLAQELSKKDAPLKVINSLLRVSNIPVEIWVEANEQVRARKDGGEPYGVAELSDGERNALFIAAAILTAPAETLFLIDEPERHLHRSIISPLLSALFRERSDCAFVISTHDITLAVDNPGARTLLVRSCDYQGQAVTAWDVDLLDGDAPINDDLKEDIIGARRRILFIEGTDQSLDKPLYSLVVPNVSVVAKGNSRAVRQAVEGIRSAAELHWLQAWGLVDGDGTSEVERQRIKDKGIFSLSFYSVEAVYYHPEVLRLVAKQSTPDDADVEQRYNTAQAAALGSLTDEHIKQLAVRAAEKSIREKIFGSLPTVSSVTNGTPVEIAIEVTTETTAEEQTLREAIERADLSAIIASYPVRETALLSALATSLGFPNRDAYEKAVLNLLIDSEPVLEFVRALFEDLFTTITPAVTGLAVDHVAVTPVASN